MNQSPEIKILFTKDIPQEWIQERLLPHLDFSIRPSLEIEILSGEKFQNHILPDVHKYLISSQNSVKAIAPLNLEGEFYVVGKKTASELEKLGKKVAQVENYAIDLAASILEKEEPQTWNFFCGNNRRDELIELLTQGGHNIREIICYNSHPKEMKLRSNNYTAFVFFSPLSVKTFYKNHSIPSNAVVFSIGNTTTGELTKYTANEIITANEPDWTSLINTINDYYAEK